MNPLLPLAAALPLLAGAPSSLDAMRWHRRVLVVAAPTPTDPLLRGQRRLLTPWHHGAADRDLSVVEVIGDHVTGTTDTAPALRRRLHLPSDRFAAVLVGKDGQVADRHDRPVGPQALEATIDAMPMRRAGQR